MKSSSDWLDDMITKSFGKDKDLVRSIKRSRRRYLRKGERYLKKWT